jgi:uncharacterized membrane protein YjfL (UPF0719 family)
MKKTLSLFVLLVISPSVRLLAADGVVEGWHARNLAEAVGYMVLFALIGILMAIIGYKLFDRCTPGDLHREIIQEKNLVAVVIGGAIILGVCIIVAAAMIG